MNKNILMICYYYPPLSDVGSKRSVAFSKYFKKYGWIPYVLSVKNPDKGYCSIGKDKPPEGVATEYSYSIVNLSRFVGRLNGVFSKLLSLFNVSVTRNYLFQIVCIPDYFWGWIPHTVIKGLWLIRKYKIGIIYVSCSPFSSALIGVFIKLLARKPLILDFRDPFAVEVVFRIMNVPKFRMQIQRYIQSYVLKHTDIFIVNNKETEQLYTDEYPELKSKIYAVHNGFDSEYVIREKPEKFKKFTIVYTGEFYFYAIRSEAFFEAIALLKQRGKIDKSNFQFVLYGDDKERILDLATEHDITDLVVASDRIPYKSVLDVIARSHLQLLRIVKPMISTKLFDGIPLNVPFLATIPKGEVEEIIHTYSPSSYVVTEDSGDKIADAILDAMSSYDNNGIADNHVEAFLERFSRENLTLRLMNIIESNVKV